MVSLNIIKNPAQDGNKSILPGVHIWKWIVAFEKHLRKKCFEIITLVVEIIA